MNLQVPNINRSNPFLYEISLNNFRNHHRLKLEFFARIIVITGNNGVGKTNLLEAMSLLTGSCGLRDANIGELIGDSGEHFAVYGGVESAGLSHAISTNSIISHDKIKKELWLNQKRAQSCKNLPILWFTPDMWNLFSRSRSQQLHFFDQLICDIFPAHRQHLINYRKLLTDRQRLFKSNMIDEIWLNALEEQAAEQALAIVVNRIEYIELLQTELQHFASNRDFVLFPFADIRLEGEVEMQLLSGGSSLMAEQWLSAKFKASRQVDKMTGTTKIGAHKTNVAVNNLSGASCARQCSTGEQKLLILLIMLGQSRIICQKTFLHPLILLDELPASIDQERKRQIFRYISQLGSQIFLTGQRLDQFDDLQDFCQKLHLQRDSD